MRLWRRWQIIDTKTGEIIRGPRFPTRFHAKSHAISMALASVWSWDYKCVKEPRRKKF